MSEFEEWYWKNRNEFLQSGVYTVSQKSYQAATEAMQAKLDKKDNFVKCAKEANKKLVANLDAKDRELKVLRGYFNKIYNLPINDNRFNNQAKELAEQFGIIDENGDLTPLVTG